MYEQKMNREGSTMCNGLFYGRGDRGGTGLSNTMEGVKKGGAHFSDILADVKKRARTFPILWQILK